MGENPGDEELELQTRRRGTGHLVEGRDDEIRRPRQSRDTESGGLASHAFEFVVGHSAQHRRGSRSRRGDDDEVAQTLEQVVDETARILTGLHDAVDRGERPRAVVCGESVDDLVEQFGVRVAEECDGPLVVHEHPALGIPIGSGNELIEQREGVTR